MEARPKTLKARFRKEYGREPIGDELWAYWTSPQIQKEFPEFLVEEEAPEKETLAVFPPRGRGAEYVSWQWQIPEDLRKTIENVYPDIIQPAKDYGYEAGEIPNIGWRAAVAFAQEDWQGFIKDLVKRKASYQDIGVILTNLGVGPGAIQQLIEQLSEYRRVAATDEDLKQTLSSVFPEAPPEVTVQIAQEDFPSFINTLVNKGRTPDTERLLGIMGYSPPEVDTLFAAEPIPDVGTYADFSAKLARQRGWGKEPHWGALKPSEEIRLRQIWDERNRELRSLYKAEYGKLPPGEAMQPLDTLRFSITNLAHQIKKGFKLLAAQVLPAYTESVMYGEFGQPIFATKAQEQSMEILREGGKELQETIMLSVDEGEKKHQEWIASHPELKPAKEWERPVSDVLKTNPEMLLNPKYLGHVIAGSLPYSLAIMGAAMIPVVGPAIAFTGAYAMETGELYDELRANGADQATARQLAVIYAPIVAGIEYAGDMFTLGKAKKAFTSPLKRALIDGLVAGTVKSGFQIISVETGEELGQRITTNIAVRAVNENRGLFEGIAETIIATPIATLPFAFLVGWGEVRQYFRQDMESKLLQSVAQSADKILEYGREELKGLVISERGAITFPEGAKEPWQMTKAEYTESGRRWRAENMPRLTGQALETELAKVAEGHKSLVQNAIASGRPVPAEVLKDYPDLKPAPEAVTPEVTQIEAMARWQKMSPAERQVIALRAKMPSTLAIKDWQSLKLFEKDAITNAMPRITEGLIPKVTPARAKKGTVSSEESIAYLEEVGRGETVTFSVSQKGLEAGTRAIITGAYIDTNGNKKLILFVPESGDVVKDNYIKTGGSAIGRGGIIVDAESVKFDKPSPLKVTPTAPAPEVTIPKAVVRYKRNYGEGKSVNIVEYEHEGERLITGTVVRGTDKSLGWYFGKGTAGLKEANRIALLTDEEFSKAEDNPQYSWEKVKKTLAKAVTPTAPAPEVTGLTQLKTLADSIIERNELRPEAYDLALVDVQDLAASLNIETDSDTFAKIIIDMVNSGRAGVTSARDLSGAININFEAGRLWRTTDLAGAGRQVKFVYLKPAIPPAPAAAPAPEVTPTNWQNAQNEAGQLIDEIESEWVSKTHVGVTAEQESRILKAIKDTSQKYNIPESTLRRSVLWEVKQTAETRDITPKTKEEIGKFVDEQLAQIPEAVQPLIPKAEEGMPEAGLQMDIFGNLIPVEPTGRGRVTQISMEEHLKLEKARREAEGVKPSEEIEIAEYQGRVEAEALAEELANDPVAQYRFQMGTRIVGKGETRKVIPNMVGLESLISIREQSFPEYLTVKQAQALNPDSTFSEYTRKGEPQYNKVPREVALDELADKFKMTPYELGKKIERLRETRRRIRELGGRVISLGVEEGLPYLAVPEETTLPMPDEVTVSEDRVVRPPPPPKEPPPPEPPPTHPPQPAPIAAGRITMLDLQAPQTVVDMYSKPDFWRRVANLPVVRKAVGFFNPAAVANNPARQAIILRAALKDEGAQKTQAVMSHLWEIGTQERVWGKTDQYGYLKAEQFAGFTMDDIRTNPTKFLADMTEQQKEWIKRASEIEKVKLDALKRNEIEINELSFEDGGEYAGRRVMGKFNDAGELIESGRIGVGGRVGAKQPFEKTRVFKTAEEGVLAGYRYMNTDEALYYNTLGAYNKIADKQMAEWILSKVDWRTTAAPEALVLQAEAARLRLRKAQQLAAALNRAVRGERVPSNTINSIASVYADQADTLRNLIPELQKPSPETANVVQILTAEAKALISEARLEYYQAVNERARAREEAMRVKYEEASIAHPAFAGKIFTGEEAKEIADILNRGLSPQFIEALGAVNKVNAIGRFFMLAGDLSPMTIQLQFLAFYRPVAYAKAGGGFVRAMFDPEFQYRYYANNRDLINRHPTLILSGRGTEFTEFMGRGGLGKKLGVLAKPLVPFQKAFEGCLDVAGIELAKSLDHRCVNPQATLDVDQFINEFRGLTSSARIGVSSTQRQVETAILLAPRYNRAIASYLFDIVHGGIRGSLARMSLAQGLAGISAMAVAISIWLGEDEDDIWQHFDPRSPKFFTWDVMGVKIGLGGKVRSILKTFGNMLRTGEVGQPALRFLRGNLSPAARTGLDLLTGKDYIGEPTRDNVLNFSKTILQNFMMIWTQNFLLEGGTLKDKAIIATAEFFGLRGYDISARKELKIKDLEELLGEVIGKTPVLTKKKPDIWDTRNMYSAVKRILERERPEDVLADKGYAGWGHMVVKIQQSEANTLPNIAFKDYNFDKAKGDTLDNYMAQWAERQRIEEAGERATYTRLKIVEGKEERTVFKGLGALVAHKVDYPNAQRGNLSKRDRELLLEYNVAADKEQFIKDHPEIMVNRLTEWFKANPRDNALFALVGQADILSKEAYNEFQKLLKELDIPNAAVLPQILPAESSLDTHFSYIDMVAEGKHGSWEAQLLLLKDAQKAEKAGVESYADWANLTLSDTPIESLELKVKNRKLSDEYDGYSDEKSRFFYIADEKERKQARADFRVKNPVYFDDLQRIEAYEHEGDQFVDLWVEHGQVASKAEGYNVEEKLWLYDHPDIHRWALAQELITDTGKDWNVPAMRITAKYRKEDAEYDAIKNPDEAEQTRLRKEYLAGNDAYRMDRRRRDAYQLTNSKTGQKFPTNQVENYVNYYELEARGYRQERMLVQNPEFARSMHEIAGIDLPDPKTIPLPRYDDLYEQFREDFQRFDGLSNHESPYYIENTTIRQRTADMMRRDNKDNLTPFGKAIVEREGLKKLIGNEKYVEEYVAYYNLPDKGTAREDFLMTHRDFYKVVWLGILHNQPVSLISAPSGRLRRLAEQGLLEEYRRKFKMVR